MTRWQCRSLIFSSRLSSRNSTLSSICSSPNAMKTPPEKNNGDADNLNDWWDGFRSYLNEKQARLFVSSYNFLFKNRTKPQILSAIIHCLGLLALVFDAVSKKISEATQAANLVSANSSE